MYEFVPKLSFTEKMSSSDSQQQSLRVEALGYLVNCDNSISATGIDALNARQPHSCTFLAEGSLHLEYVQCENRICPMDANAFYVAITHQTTENSLDSGFFMKTCRMKTWWSFYQCFLFCISAITLREKHKEKSILETEKIPVADQVRPMLEEYFVCMSGSLLILK